MAGYESASLAAIETVLDGLDEATAAEVYAATLQFAARALAAVAASRADVAVGAVAPLVLTSTGATETPLALEAAADQTEQSDADLFYITAAGGGKVVRVDPQGDMYLNLAEHTTAPGPSGPGIKIDGQGNASDSYILVTDGVANVFELTPAGIQVYGTVVDRETVYVEPIVTLDVGIANVHIEGSAGAFRLLRTGHAVITNHAAPADGELVAGELALWFDQTNGAAKLKLKGKSANGTVVVGEVALT